jgi:hypothetical protein
MATGEPLPTGTASAAHDSVEIPPDWLAGSKLQREGPWKLDSGTRSFGPTNPYLMTPHFVPLIPWNSTVNGVSGIFQIG